MYRGHPAVACDPWPVDAAPERITTGLFNHLIVAVDSHRRLGHYTHVAVVNKLDFPGAEMEIVLNEREIVAGSQVLRLAGGVDRLIVPVAELVPIFTSLTAVAPTAHK